MTRTLLIGYGNTLRSDDGAGAVVAEEVAALNIPGVDTRVCQQLQLDLVPDFLAYRRVILVDAAVSGESVVIRRISPKTADGSSTHHITPEVLLQTAKNLYDAELEMYLCAVRGSVFSFGTALSPETRVHCTHAVQLISMLIQTAHERKDRFAPIRRLAT